MNHYPRLYSGLIFSLLFVVSTYSASTELSVIGMNNENKPAPTQMDGYFGYVFFDDNKTHIPKIMRNGFLSSVGCERKFLSDWHPAVINTRGYGKVMRETHFCSASSYWLNNGKHYRFFSGSSKGFKDYKETYLSTYCPMWQGEDVIIDAATQFWGDIKIRRNNNVFKVAKDSIEGVIFCSLREAAKVMKEYVKDSSCHSGNDLNATDGVYIVNVDGSYELLPTRVNYPSTYSGRKTIYFDRNRRFVRFDGITTDRFLGQEVKSGKASLIENFSVIAITQTEGATQFLRGEFKRLGL